MDTAQLTQLVSDLLAALGMPFDAITITNGHRTIVAVSLAEPEQLIGPGGEHLRALNTIAHRLVENKHGEDAAHFLIDINGYHEAQLEKVRANARTLAQRARLFKHEVEMEPMSSYERLVVHELFADDAEIQTESAGEGKFRHIVIKPK